MVFFLASAALVSAIIGTANAQAPPFAVQSTGWNSSFELSAAQIQLGNLSQSTADVLETILNFDQSQLAGGGPSQDAFYTVPKFANKNAYPKKPGQVLKVEEVTDASLWSLPAGIAMSRIMYTTTNLNGTLIPASMFVLWPYQNKQFPRSATAPSPSEAPVVLWTHGTSGFYAGGAPSTRRDLFYADIVPFTLAQAGYVVVAPDYAGLGVDKSWDGTRIPHQYFVREAGAHDALNAMRAAQATFGAQLSKNYVAVGHSQGASVSWGLTEVLARPNNSFKDIGAGLLGNVLFAPPTNYSHLASEFLNVWVGKDLDKIYPTFNLSDWFTPLGVDQIELLNQIEGGQFATVALFSSTPSVLRPDWRNGWFDESFAELADPGSLPVKAPMIIFQGTADNIVNYNDTMATFKATCAKYPNNIEFVTVPEAGHFPGMDASRMAWLQWIGERFEGKPTATHGCKTSTLKSFRPVSNYQVVRNSFLQWAGESQYSYEILISP